MSSATYGEQKGFERFRYELLETLIAANGSDACCSSEEVHAQRRWGTLESGLHEILRASHGRVFSDANAGGSPNENPISGP